MRKFAKKLQNNLKKLVKNKMLLLALVILVVVFVFLVYRKKETLSGETTPKVDEGCCFTVNVTGKPSPETTTLSKKPTNPCTDPKYPRKDIFHTENGTKNFCYPEEKGTMIDGLWYACSMSHLGEEWGTTTDTNYVTECNKTPLPTDAPTTSRPTNKPTIAGDSDGGAATPGDGTTTPPPQMPSTRRRSPPLPNLESYEVQSLSPEDQPLN